MRDAISSAIAGQTHYDHEYRITYPDGAVHWIHARDTPPTSRTAGH